MSSPLLSRLHAALGATAVVGGLASLWGAWSILTGMGSTGGGAQAAGAILVFGFRFAGLAVLGAGVVDLVLANALHEEAPNADIIATALALPNVVLALVLLAAAALTVVAVLGL